jgi:hypothetical protein
MVQREQSDVVVLHFPINYFLHRQTNFEATYMLGSTLHWANVVNGYGSTVPSGFHNDMGILNMIPHPLGLQRACELGVTVIALNSRTPDHQRQTILGHFAAGDAGRAARISDTEWIIEVNKERLCAASTASPSRADFRQ